MIKKHIKYLDLYKKEYAAFQVFKRMKHSDLIKLGIVSGLDMTAYKTKSILIKGLCIKLGMGIPVNFNEW